MQIAGVIDCSSEFQGRSLSAELLKTPNLTNQIVSHQGFEKMK